MEWTFLPSTLAQTFPESCVIPPYLEHTLPFHFLKTEPPPHSSNADAQSLHATLQRWMHTRAVCIHRKDPTTKELFKNLSDLTPGDGSVVSLVPLTLLPILKTCQWNFGDSQNIHPTTA